MGGKLIRAEVVEDRHPCGVCTLQAVSVADEGVRLRQAAHSKAKPDSLCRAVGGPPWAADGMHIQNEHWGLYRKLQEI